MALPTSYVRRHPRVLTASAVKVDPQDSEARRMRQLDWQDQCFLRAKNIPELNYASRFYSRMLKRLRIIPGMRDEQDRVEPITSGAAVEILDRIQDPGGGRSQILGQYGRLMFIVGEGYLFGRDLNTDNERWAFVSGREVERSDNEILWRPTEQGEAKRYVAGRSAELYRMWSPDPERSGDPESPMRSVLEIAEELSILTKTVKATALSRMLAGLLKIPSEISFGPDEPGTDDDPEMHPIMRDLIEHATGVVENIGMPEALAPWLIEGAAEFLDKLEWLPMHDAEKDYMEKDLRFEAVKRMATGLDMPAELLLGLADANHWGARQIMHAAWQSHGAGIAEQFCDDLAEAYLRPALREEGFSDWKRIVITYDDADVVVSPDRSEDAHKVFGNLGIGWEGYRKQTGTPEAFAPNDEEMKIMLAIRMREPAFLKGTKFEIEELAPLPGPRGPAPDPSNNGDADPQDGPPRPGPSGVSRRESRSLALRGAAELAMLRCRSLAGSRLRSKKLNGYAEVQNVHLAAALGHAMLAELEMPDPQILVNGGATDFVELCVEWGVDRIQALSMAQMIEVYSARTLCDEGLPPFPSGLEAAIERAHEVSTEMQVVRGNNEALDRLSRMVEGGLDALHDQAKG